MITWDRNIRYQQNLTDRKLARVVLGSNIRLLVKRTRGNNGVYGRGDCTKLRVHRNAVAAKAAKASIARDRSCIRPI